MIRMLLFPLVILGALLAGVARAAESADATVAVPWPQFRGPGGRGIAPGDVAPPVAFGPAEKVLWAADLASGHSSPVVDRERVYVTALRDGKLLTIALDRQTGDRLWEAEAPYEKLESVHRVGSPATPSVATDGRHVVSFFGSCGLFCYRPSGQLLWQRPLGPFQNSHGAPASPLLAEGKVVLLEDHDAGSFLAAFDVATGEQVWRAERPDFGRNYGSPCLWRQNGEIQIVTVGSGRVVAYSLADGQQAWMVRGAARVHNSTPVAGPEGNLYIASTGGGDAPPQPLFAEIVTAVDTNGDGRLAEAELPPGLVKTRFGQFDRNRDGFLDEEEYGLTRGILAHARTVAMAVKPGGAGDITDSHVLWSYDRSVPRNASPLVYRGGFYMVKDGGVLTSLDAATGEPIKQGRLRGRGQYFSSPVASGGLIYLCSDRGEVNVVRAQQGGQWKQEGLAHFEESIMATPAIAQGRLYLRTENKLYCIGD